MKNCVESAWIEITEKCNLKCPYCYMDANHQKRELSVSDYLVGINKMKCLGVKNIVLSGGEPCVHPDICQFIRIASESGMLVGIATNGTVLNKDILSSMKENNVYVQVSIDSLNPETYVLSRGINLLNVLKHNIEVLVQKNINISFSSVLSDSTADEVIPICDYAKGLGVGSLHFGVLIPSDRSKKRQFELHNLYDTLIRLYNYQIKNYLSVQIDIIEEMIKNIVFRTEDRKFYCRAMGAKTIQIDIDGTSHQCGLIPLNGLNIYSQNDTFVEDYLNSLFTASTSELDGCKVCPYKEFCCGGCRACAFLSGGDLYSRNPYCSDYKRILDIIVNDYQQGRLEDYVSFLRIVCSSGARMGVF